MRNKLNIISKVMSFTLTAFLLASLLQINPVIAAPSYKYWESKKTADVKKTWTVTLSSPADVSSIKDSNIYVVDEKNQKVPVKLSLSSNNTKISVTPVNAYSSTKKYRLYFTQGITSQNKKALTQKIIMPFTIDPNAKEAVTTSAISKVEINQGTYVTAVKVSTNNTVAKVKCNGREMHYLGNHIFELGIAGAKPGQSLTISAYDAAGKLIVSQKHVVK